MRVILPVLHCTFLAIAACCFQQVVGQSNFFDVGSKKEKAKVITAWSEETNRLCDDRNFRMTSDVFYVIQKYSLRREFIGFHETIFTRFFGKSFAQLTDNEKEEIADIMCLEGTASRDLRYPDVFLFPFVSGKKKNRYVYPEAHEKSLVYISDMNRKEILPVVTGKEMVESACLGMRIIDASYENKAKGFMVTEIKLGGPAFLAGIQPGDLILSFINPMAGEAEKAYGAELLPIKSAAELKNRSCGSLTVAFVPFNMLYKDPTGKGYLPFTGEILFGLPEVPGAWAATVQSHKKTGSRAQSLTQYDKFGVHSRSDNRVAALRYENYLWPDRNQANGVTDTIQRLKILYDYGLQQLQAKAANISCLYDDASKEFQALEVDADKLDKIYLFCNGKTRYKTIDQVKSKIDGRCSGEWWNMGGSNIKRVVRSLINGDEKYWGNHQTTELKADNWSYCVEVLFVELQNQHKRLCLSKFPEPTDTFTVEVSAVPDMVWRNRWGIETMRIRGREAETYYYYARKKYSSAYVHVFNELRTNNPLIRFLNGEVSLMGEIADYVSILLSKYGCNSPQANEFESKVFKALLFLRPGSRDTYLREFKAYNGK